MAEGWEATWHPVGNLITSSKNMFEGLWVLNLHPMAKLSAFGRILLPPCHVYCLFNISPHIIYMLNILLRVQKGGGCGWGWG